MLLRKMWKYCKMKPKSSFDKYSLFWERVKSRSWMFFSTGTPYLLFWNRSRGIVYLQAVGNLTQSLLQALQAWNRCSRALSGPVRCRKGGAVLILKIMSVEYANVSWFMPWLRHKCVTWLRIYAPASVLVFGLVSQTIDTPPIPPHSVPFSL